MADALPSRFQSSAEESSASENATKGKNKNKDDENPEPAHSSLGGKDDDDDDEEDSAGLSGMDGLLALGADGKGAKKRPAAKTRGGVTKKPAGNTGGKKKEWTANWLFVVEITDHGLST